MEPGATPVLQRIRQALGDDDVVAFQGFVKSADAKVAIDTMLAVCAPSARATRWVVLEHLLCNNTAVADEYAALPATERAHTFEYLSAFIVPTTPRRPVSMYASFLGGADDDRGGGVVDLARVSAALLDTVDVASWAWVYLFDKLASSGGAPELCLHMQARVKELMASSRRAAVIHANLVHVLTEFHRDKPPFPRLKKTEGVAGTVAVTEEVVVPSAFVRGVLFPVMGGEKPGMFSDAPMAWADLLNTLDV